MTLDYKTPSRPPSRRARGKRRAPLILSLLIVVAALSIFLSRQSVPPTEASLPPAPVAEFVAPPPPPPIPEPKVEIREETIRSGDTITSLLGGYFSAGEILRINKQSRDVFPLTGICAGQPYKVCLVDGDFERFEYDINRDEQLIIRRQEEDFAISRIPIDYETVTDRVRGTITSSLFEAVAEQDERAELAIALADIFAWDIDFIRDIREGDSFQALVEKRSREGEPAGYGKILAAEFINQGRTYRAFLFKDGDRPATYYDEKGKSVRKAFLRAPLAFSRISSGFTMRRYHPITKTWKAHPAIDYAAPQGTPIEAIGDGTITRIGYTKYNGNYIKIRHNSSYETLYLHMSRFAKGMKKGKRLAQGQTIGFVGSTGLATGPHLCFRMYKNGSPVNPNKVKSTAAAPISKEEMARFKELTSPLTARLEGREILEAKTDLVPAENMARN